MVLKKVKHIVDKFLGKVNGRHPSNNDKTAKVAKLVKLAKSRKKPKAKKSK